MVTTPHTECGSTCLLYCHLLTRFGRLAVLGAALVFSGYGQRVASQEWHPVCVRRPVEITSSNKGAIKGEECLQTSVQASLAGESGYLQTFRCRDGMLIRVFQPECAERFGPCRMKFSVGDGGWSDGIFELPNALIHRCGSYSCNWYTYRNGYGKLVIATGMSY
jgi:hypothetical protein